MIGLPVPVLLLATCVVLAMAMGFRHRGTRKSQGRSSSTQRAEVDGGVWERLSVFGQIEGTIKNSPNLPAVICFCQPADHLETIAPGWIGVVSSLSNGHTEVETRVTKDKVVRQLNGVSDISTNGWSEVDCLQLSYAQLHTAALKLAVGLHALGIRPGATMVMLIPNGAEYTILLWACILLRITYVSLDPALLDISGFTTLKHMLRTLKPQVVVAPDPDSGRVSDVAIDELQLPRPIRLSLSAKSHSTAWMTIADVLSRLTESSFDEASLVASARNDAPDRVHSIIFTSGTSGQPKGCPQRVAGMSHTLHSQSWLIDEDTGAFAVQQAHNSRGIAPAQTLQTWRAGGCVVMTGQHFSVSSLIEAIRRHRATFIVLTPPMVHGMRAELARGPLDIGCVKRIQIGGDTVTRDVIRKCAAIFPDAQVCVNHGMTEGGGSFQWPLFHTPIAKIPFLGEICPVGVVAPGSRIRIWDDEKKTIVKRSELGELHISNPSIIKHYLAGGTRDAFYVDRGRAWFKTGDIATVNQAGLLFILGRKKDVVRRAGVVIMPALIESSIEAFNGCEVSNPNSHIHETWRPVAKTNIVQAIVVAAPHPTFGAEPFAVLSSYNSKTDAEIKEHVRTALGEHYTLGGVVSLKKLGLEAFPINATHKIVKTKLQADLLRYLQASN
ncbi:putative AMP-dependent synthetase/ligase domain-containing protein [Seiridium unicorne]|uniref:AMP-dependent synthetase/ligase domain-containing protein n=1 Tax=Seiridium unicorne TaxID=138068 RepID=A0ABR2UU77_9PEZI